MKNIIIIISFLSLLILTSCGTNKDNVANSEQNKVTVTPTINNVAETTLTPVPTKPLEFRVTTQMATGIGDDSIRNGGIANQQNNSSNTQTPKVTPAGNNSSTSTVKPNVSPTGKPTPTTSGITVIAQTNTTLSNKEKEKLLTDLKDQMEELLNVISRIKELDEQKTKLKF